MEELNIRANNLYYCLDDNRVNKLWIYLTFISCVVMHLFNYINIFSKEILATLFMETIFVSLLCTITNYLILAKLHDYITMRLILHSLFVIFMLLICISYNNKLYNITFNRFIVCFCSWVSFEFTHLMKYEVRFNKNYWNGIIDK